MSDCSAAGGRKSTAVVEIVPVEFSPHPNADTLSVTQVFGGYSYVGKTADWVGVKKAAYVPPDNVVDTDRPEFRFLKPVTVIVDGKLAGRVEDPNVKFVRVKAKKLRGVISFGLMVPVPDDAVVGDDWTERLGVTHFEPETEEEKKAKSRLNLGGEVEKAPEVNTGAYYDIDAGRKYRHLFHPGEPVVVTEKLDGTNCRVVWWGDRLWVKSRNEWKRRQADYSHLTVEGLVEKGVPEDKAREIIDRKRSETPKVNDLWQVVENTPGLVRLCQENPGTVVFGEVYGNTNCVKYGLPEGNRFAAFDVFRDGEFLDFRKALALACRYGVPWAPLLNEVLPFEVTPPIVHDIPFDFDRVCEMAEGGTLIADAKPKTIREGVVVVPTKERWDPRVGRVKLKFVSGAYLEKYR